MIKVIQWATGSTGRTALRRIIDHADLDLVGLYVYDGNKIGLDATQACSSYMVVPIES